MYQIIAWYESEPSDVEVAFFDTLPELIVALTGHDYTSRSVRVFQFVQPQYGEGQIEVVDLTRGR